MLTTSTLQVGGLAILRLNEKRSLTTERLTLASQLRDAQTRRRVVVDAERRLGMHVASDSQTRVVAPPGKAP